jgi:hypothetical protein
MCGVSDRRPRDAWPRTQFKDGGAPCFIPSRRIPALNCNADGGFGNKTCARPVIQGANNRGTEARTPMPVLAAVRPAEVLQVRSRRFLTCPGIGIGNALAARPGCALSSVNTGVSPLRPCPGFAGAFFGVLRGFPGAVSRVRATSGFTGTLAVVRHQPWTERPDFLAEARRRGGIQGVVAFPGVSVRAVRSLFFEAPENRRRGVLTEPLKHGNSRACCFLRASAPPRENQGLDLASGKPRGPNRLRDSLR